MTKSHSVPYSIGVASSDRICAVLIADLVLQIQACRMESGSGRCDLRVHVMLLDLPWMLPICCCRPYPERCCSTFSWYLGMPLWKSATTSTLSHLPHLFYLGLHHFPCALYVVQNWWLKFDLPCSGMKRSGFFARTCLCVDTGFTSVVIKTALQHRKQLIGYMSCWRAVTTLDQRSPDTKLYSC